MRSICTFREVFRENFLKRFSLLEDKYDLPKQNQYFSHSVSSL